MTDRVDEISAIHSPRLGFPPMKMPLAALLLLAVTPCCALAQQPLVSRIDRQPPPTAATAGTTSSAPQVSSEMWMYLHEEQRHDDPAQSVRRKAEYKADQRMTRINS